MIREYLNYLNSVRQLPQGTCETYENGLRDFAGFAARYGYRWSSVTRQLIEAWVADLGTRQQKPATIKTKLSAVRGIYTWMMMQGMMSTNPARYIQTPKKAKRLPMTCDLEQIDKYLRSVATTREEKMLRALVALLTDTGIRISEALNLRREDFDRKTRSFVVTGKGDKERRVYYGERAARFLSYYAGYKDGFIFENRDQRDVRFKLYASTAPYLEKCHPHMLRHTYATAMVNAGCDIKILSQALGHTSVKTTEIYAQASNLNVAAAQQRLHPIK